MTTTKFEMVGGPLDGHIRGVPHRRDGTPHEWVYFPSCGDMVVMQLDETVFKCAVYQFDEDRRSYQFKGYER